MPQELVLSYTGTLAPEHHVSIRTLGKTLPHLQRAIDKLVYADQLGHVAKFSKLPNDLYPHADLYVSVLEANGVRIPFVTDLAGRIIDRFGAILRDPFEKALAEADEQYSLRDHLDSQFNRITHGMVEGKTQEQVLAEREDGEDSSWTTAAVLKDINTMLTPLRSSAVPPEDTIKMQLSGEEEQSVYEFNKHRSSGFNSLVTEQRLAEPAIYFGKLVGLRDNHSRRFPYVGDFRSSVTEVDCSLLIPFEKALNVLRPHNLSGHEFAIWASPLAVYGAHDDYRGDIVFIEFA